MNKANERRAKITAIRIAQTIIKAKQDIQRVEDEAEERTKELGIDINKMVEDILKLDVDTINNL